MHNPFHRRRHPATHAKQKLLKSQAGNDLQDDDLGTLRQGLHKGRNEVDGFDHAESLRPRVESDAGSGSTMINGMRTASS